MTATQAINHHPPAPAGGRTAPALRPAQLPLELFEALFAGAKPERYAAGRNLFMQDDASDRLYGVISGTIEIAIYSLGGRKLVANFETAHSLVGEIGVLDGGHRTATAACLSDCTLVSISRGQLFDRIEKTPVLARAMIELLCARLRWVSGELGDQAHLKIEARLAKRLLFLGDLIAAEEGWIIISQAELAEFLGATRESVNKTLTEWKRSRLIDIRRGGIRVLDRGALVDIGEHEDD
jgi:CRP/FNR family transcriptional regulator, cyclic AMP receptor protein